MTDSSTAKPTLIIQSPFRENLSLLDDPFIDVEIRIHGVHECIQMHRDVLGYASSALESVFDGQLHHHLVYETRYLHWEFGPDDDMDKEMYNNTVLKWLRFCYGEDQEFQLDECKAALLVLTQMELKCEKDVKKKILDFMKEQESKEKRVGLIEAQKKAMSLWEERRAFEQCERAATQGDLDAMFTLATHYMNGCMIEQDKKKGIELYDRAAILGNSNAMTELAGRYMNGDEVEQDKKKGIELYQRAVEKGNDKAMYKLGNCFMNGDGVEQNKKKGIELYQLAVEKDNEDAMNSLGECFMNGDGVEQDKKKGIELYQRAVEKGSTKAMINLGLCYKNGDGVEQDYKKTVELYEKVLRKAKLLQ